MKTKYIITADGAIIFAPSFTHAEVAGRHKVLSAGFVSIRTDDEGTYAHPYGESVSLGIESKPEDARALNNALGIGKDW